MSRIDVACVPTDTGWRCRVIVAGPHSTTEHDVGVARSDLERLAPDAVEPTDLVYRSFDFLLEHEPNESILRSFDLPVIGRYFPDWERTIRE